MKHLSIISAAILALCMLATVGCGGDEDETGNETSLSPQDLVSETDH